MAHNAPSGRCPWTGEPLPAVAPRAQRKKFASTSARNEAHTAARKFAEHLIAQGFLTWETIRQWHDGHKLAGEAPCTARGDALEPPTATTIAARGPDAP